MAVLPRHWLNDTNDQVTRMTHSDNKLVSVEVQISSHTLDVLVSSYIQSTHKSLH